VERVLEVHADAAQRFTVTFPLEVTLDGEYASFSGPEKARTLYDTVRGSPRLETFPVAMVRTSRRSSVSSPIHRACGRTAVRCSWIRRPIGWPS